MRVPRVHGTWKAAALAAAGATYAALRLPFTEGVFSGGQSTITVRTADTL